MIFFISQRRLVRMTFRKKSAAVFFAAFIVWGAYSQSPVSQNKRNFIRGSIADKTSAVVKARTFACRDGFCARL